MMVLVPVSLGIIWLVLMAIFAIIVCCRKRSFEKHSAYSETGVQSVFEVQGTIPLRQVLPTDDGLEYQRRDWRLPEH